jgi:hypothetical protein
MPVGVLLSPGRIGFLWTSRGLAWLCGSGVSVVGDPRLRVLIAGGSLGPLPTAVEATTG